MQLQTSDILTCELLHGTPDARVAGAFGPVAVFRPERVVAYRLDSPGGVRLFVFRTLAVRDRLAARVPGVHPGVRLLMHLRSRGPIERVRWLFADLKKRGEDPSRLSDLFYVRLSLLFGGGRPRRSALRRLAVLDTTLGTAHAARRSGAVGRQT